MREEAGGTAETTKGAVVTVVVVQQHLHELEPAFGEEKFFFEDEYEQMRKGNG